MHIKDRAYHRIVKEKLKQGIDFDVNSDKTDIFVKTTELSHGFKLGHNYEASPFDLGTGNKKISVQLDDESNIPIANAKLSLSDEGRNFLYLPFYLLGWTSITSYDIEYLSSNDTINVCGVLNYNNSNGELSMPEPALVFLGSVNDAISSLKDKIFDNFKVFAIASLATIVWGTICFKYLRKLHSQISYEISDAYITEKCKTWNQEKPSVIRYPCMHVSECTFCYEQSLRVNANLAKQCLVCGKVSTDIVQIK